MFDTNDVFNDAVRGSTLYTDDNSSVKSGIGSKVVAILFVTSVAVVGFNFYSPIDSVVNKLAVKNELISEQELVVKNELITEIQTKSETLVVEKVSDSEEAYLSALREIESELNEERESINLDAQEQSDLSLAMSNLIDDDDTLLADTSTYTNELRKEIGVESDKVAESTNAIVDNSTKEESRTVIVKKGDTLQGISNKFYGDAMNYKRIVASNDSLRTNDTIYEGQTILLPY